MNYEQEESDEEEENLENDKVHVTPEHESHDFIGFNGRCNKMVDTCYAFWVGASLGVGISSRVKAQLLTVADSRT